MRAAMTINSLQHLLWSSAVQTRSAQVLPLQNWAGALLWAGLCAWTRGDQLRRCHCLNSRTTCPAGEAQGISFPLFPQYFFKEICGIESQHKPDTDT